MKKFITNIMLFVILVPIVLFFLIGIFGVTAPNYLWKNIHSGSYGYISKRLEEINKTENIDVLILGSSHAYRGFDPRIFNVNGFKMFNLGSSSQTPIQTEFLLKKYLQKLNPKIVIFEVNAMSFTSDGLESSLDIVSNINQIDLNILSVVLKVNKISLYNTYLNLVFKKIFHLKNFNQECTNANNEHYILGGYVERINPNKETLADSVSINELNLKFKKSQCESFENILKMLIKQNVKVILVQAPVSKSFYNSGKYNDENDKYFSSFKGIKYYNFNKILNLNDNYFYEQHNMFQ